MRPSSRAAYPLGRKKAGPGRRSGPAKPTCLSMADGSLPLGTRMSRDGADARAGTGGRMSGLRHRIDAD
jgi:hypothetical protein